MEENQKMNVLVLGGSGAGKTRFYWKPNIMQCNTSFIILDPKGEIVRDLGYLLEEQGYEVKATITVEMSKFNKVSKVTVPEEVLNNAKEEVE